MWVRTLLVAGCILLITALARGDDAEAPTHFESAVAPLLAKRCLTCHNPSELSGGLDLTRAEAAANGGESGAAFVPGKPDESLLWQRIAADEMPPEHPLVEDERAILRKWIEAGAVWGAAEIDRFRYSSDARAGYDWWSLQPVMRPTPPAAPTEYENWPRNEIDRFILQGLNARGLAPAPEADRRTLLRRLSFDLLGLPPTPEEIAAFEADAAPDAYERVVDRLLASPQYGVRWARHWLDVVRFGESNGFEFDEFRKHAWPYRDWVVDALNADLPYDEFARWQIAGDALRPNDLEATIATGFMVAGAYDTVGQGQISAAMRAVVRQDELEDLVGVVGQTFLGLTVQCARCHDHKFDPIRQQEYYQLVAALAGVRHGERDLAELSTCGARREMIDVTTARRGALQTELASLVEPVQARLLAEKSRQPVDLKPYLAWDFLAGTSFAPEAELTLHGGAARTERGLELNGDDAYASTAALTRELTAKTLEVRVRLNDLAQQGGAAISVQKPDGGQFDAIVYGEREPRQWMSGSEGFQRTQSFQGPGEEEALDRAVHVRITYAEDGTIRCYRDGRPYGASYNVGKPARFAAGEAQVVLGLRHAPATPQRLLAGTIEYAALYDRALREDEVAVAAGSAVAQDELLAAFDDAERGRYETITSEILDFDETLTRLHPSRCYALTAKEPEPTHLLARGDPAQPRDMVTPRGIASLTGVAADWKLAADAPEAERRAALARWITDPANPLFARVMVNRVWHYHFGAGLVDTPNDFGFNGGRPTNQPLLDWLAAEFVAREYRIKELHRLIVTSAAYRQAWRHDDEAINVDADNRLLWRGPTRRLEAEAVRDAMLCVAGVLDERLGGPGYQDMKISFAPGTTAYLYAPIDTDLDRFRRRTLYRVWARSGRSAMLDVLDCPDPSATSPRRAVTTTPLQALSLLNNAFSLHLADRFAERLVRDAGPEPDAQVRRAYQLAYGRDPSSDELATAVAIVKEHGASVMTRAIFNSNEFLYVD